MAALGGLKLLREAFPGCHSWFLMIESPMKSCNTLYFPHQTVYQSVLESNICLTSSPDSKFREGSPWWSGTSLALCLACRRHAVNTCWKRELFIPGRVTHCVLYCLLHIPPLVVITYAFHLVPLSHLHIQQKET